MKKNLGAVNALYPMPVTLVGALVEGKPNYVTIAHVGIMTHKTVSLGINKVHYTNAGIKENKCFSINIPSEDMVVETDYCGLESGRETNKSDVFKTFYGSLAKAPMIEECPINMECRLLEVLDRKSHEVFIGEVVETFCDEKALTQGTIDYSLVKPMFFDMPKRNYWKLGKSCGEAWSIGKKYKK